MNRLLLFVEIATAFIRSLQFDYLLQTSIGFGISALGDSGGAQVFRSTSWALERASILAKASASYRTARSEKGTTLSM